LPYKITYSYTDPSGAFAPASDSSQTLTVTQAAPAVGVADAGGTYNGGAFAATATVAGVIAGVDDSPAATLEGVAPGLTYYSGSYSSVAQLAGLTPLGGAPVNAGSYTVLASFPGSADYSAGQALANFSIAQASLTVTADSTSRAYGVANPPLTASYRGFVNGESLATSGVTGSPSLSSPATASSPPGAYPLNIAAGTLSAANYAFTFAGGTLTVSAAQLSATGVNLGATAGAPFFGTVATFTNPDPFGGASSYSAVIRWGDGSATAGVISGTGSTLSVSGSHTYGGPGSETIAVTIRHRLGYTTTATTSATATVTSLALGVQSGLTGTLAFWHGAGGQALIASFNGGAGATGLSGWLAASLPNLYGFSAGASNLQGKTNAQVAAFFQAQYALGGSLVEAQVLAVALNVYATTQALGGTAGQAYGFSVSDSGLGARSFNVGADGAALGVANNSTLTVYQLLVAVNRQSVNGLLYPSGWPTPGAGQDGVRAQQAADLFDALNQAGSIAA
jgi:hypothetical protein